MTDLIMEGLKTKYLQDYENEILNSAVEGLTEDRTF